MLRETFAGGVLRERWDYTTRVYTAWDDQGTQTAQRPFNAEENALADAELSVAAQETNEIQVAANLDGIFDSLRTVATGTGTFVNNTARDAAIRACARGIILIIRLLRRRLDAVD